MIEPKRILLTTDFSESAHNALRYAVEFAEKCGAELCLLHVYETPLMAPVNVFTTLENTMVQVNEKMKEVVIEKLKQLKLKEASSVTSYSFLAKEGNINKQILNTISSESIDLVIMGTRGAYVDRGLFMGSTASYVVKHSPCPVLTIPIWAHFQPISKIVYATDLRYDESAIVAYLISVAKSFDAEVIILHIDDLLESAEWSQVLLREIVVKAAYDKISFKEIAREDVLMGINEFIYEYGVDVVATTTATTTFFDQLMHKSLTKEILLLFWVTILVKIPLIKT